MGRKSNDLRPAVAYIKSKFIIVYMKTSRRVRDRREINNNTHREMVQLRSAVCVLQHMVMGAARACRGAHAQSYLIASGPSTNSKQPARHSCFYKESNKTK